MHIIATSRLHKVMWVIIGRVKGFNSVGQVNTRNNVCTQCLEEW